MCCAVDIRLVCITLPMAWDPRSWLANDIFKLTYAERIAQIVTKIKKYDEKMES